MFSFTMGSGKHFPDSKVHVANRGPTWVLLAPGGPRVDPMNLVSRDIMHTLFYSIRSLAYEPVPDYKISCYQFKTILVAWMAHL